MGQGDSNIGKPQKDSGDSELKNLQAKNSENLSAHVQDLLKDQATEKVAVRNADQPSTKTLNDKQEATLVAQEKALKGIESTQVASVIDAGAKALQSGDRDQMQKAREQHKQIVIGLKAYQDAGGKFHDPELEQMVKTATA